MWDLWYAGQNYLISHISLAAFLLCLVLSRHNIGHGRNRTKLKSTWNLVWPRWLINIGCSHGDTNAPFTLRQPLHWLGYRVFEWSALSSIRHQSSMVTSKKLLIMYTVLLVSCKLLWINPSIHIPSGLWSMILIIYFVSNYWCYTNSYQHALWTYSSPLQLPEKYTAHPAILCWRWFALKWVVWGRFVVCCIRFDHSNSSSGHILGQLDWPNRGM